MKFRVAFLLAVAFFLAAAQGGADEIDLTAVLPDLPIQYRPASLDVSPSGDSPYPKVAVTLSGRRNELPVCISRLFALPRGVQWSIEALVAETNRVLPPYLLVKLPQISDDKGNTLEGVHLLFGLASGALWYVGEHRPGSAMLRSPDEFCSRSELGQLRWEKQALFQLGSEDDA
ncbi:MAG: hypothetical protein AAGA68_22360 [Pseudomonadota bacterium]